MSDGCDGGFTFLTPQTKLHSAHALPLLLTRGSNEPRGLGPNDLGEGETGIKENSAGGKTGKEKSRGGWRMVGKMMVKVAETYLGFRMDHKPPIS